ncbi:hypothetical protein [Geobacter sp. AOG2]|uniref:hypothetical protein n=1 Tax=Geobacter sp. AOG2 TaxID=1566347 RepID=UPI001CC3F0A9|nr:hypothetical protein [Geobacter sp. AOG2]GFE62838.1 hypothetical protein AOG2_34270 [Geobacter sp. AOG2]
MPRFKVAHVKEQGADLIIFPLDPAFGSKNNEEQQEIIKELQTHTQGAGLAGTVVPIWKKGDCLFFNAPRNWHPFLKKLSWNDAIKNINKEIYW